MKNLYIPTDFMYNGYSNWSDFVYTKWSLCMIGVSTAQICGSNRSLGTIYINIFIHSLFEQIVKRAGEWDMAVGQFVIGVRNKTFPRTHQGSSLMTVSQQLFYGSSFRLLYLFAKLSHLGVQCMNNWEENQGIQWHVKKLYIRTSVYLNWDSGWFSVLASMYVPTVCAII